MLRLLMCLNLWTAPVPVIHAHEGFGSATVDLLPHLERHHSESNELDCLCLHLHLLSWGDIRHESGQPDEPEPSETTEIAQSVLPLHAHELQLGTLATSRPIVCEIAARVDGTVAGTLNLDSLLSGRRPQLACLMISRC